MRFRQLGQSGLKVSEIGFGCWGLGGVVDGAPLAYGQTDDQQSLQTLKFAFEQGINFYDTADLYGLGKSETLLGQAFHQVRDQVILASKVGYLNRAGEQNFTLSYIEKSLDQSLQRLNSDYLDLYQLHDPFFEHLNDDLFSLFDKFKQTGKIRAFGISLRSPQMGLELLKQYPVDCIETNFNLADQRAIELGLWTLCREKQVGVVIRTPLCFGFLTGDYEANEEFSEGDHRQRWSAQKRQEWIDARQLMDEIKLPLMTPAQQALQFCLSYPEISTVIPGMLTLEHVTDNVGTIQFPLLKPEQRARVEQNYRLRNK